MTDAIGLLEETVVTELEHAELLFEDPSSGLKPITLSEWESKRVELSEPLARRLGETRFNKWLSVSPDPEDGWWKLTAKQFVGGFEVTTTPTNTKRKTF